MVFSKIFKTGEYRFDKQLTGVVTEKEEGDEILIVFHPKKFLFDKNIEIGIWDFPNNSIISSGNVGVLSVFHDGYEFQLILESPRGGYFIHEESSLSTVNPSKEILLARIVWNLESDKYQEILKNQKEKFLNHSK